MPLLSKRTSAAANEFEKVLTFFQNTYQQGASEPDACDFTFGNPHEMPLQGLVDAIQKNAEPQNKDWFAYKTSEDEPRACVADCLSAELGLDFEPEDIAMTQGAFAAISLAFHMLLDPGDEVVIPVPGWFCYAPMLRIANLTPVPALLDQTTFDLDLAAIEAAITPRTRMVVVNSPGNPTGRVIPLESLIALADLLERASARNNARIWLLSDEPYRRIRFDDIPFTSPATYYPHTLIDYSYGKVLLAPGQRLGYLALSPLMPRAEREALSAAALPTQMAIGWSFPNAVMQYSVETLEGLSLDLRVLSRKRQIVCNALKNAGYEITHPEATFYLWGKAPGGDSGIFAANLAEKGVFVMPGTLFDQPEHFRMCLTANEAMIERALPALVEYATDS